MGQENSSNQGKISRRELLWGKLPKGLVAPLVVFSASAGVAGLELWENNRQSQLLQTIADQKVMINDLAQQLASRNFPSGSAPVPQNTIEVHKI